MKRVCLKYTNRIKKVMFFSEKYVEEAIEGIQNRGGEILSVAVSPITMYSTEEHLLVVYEDNNHYSEIKTFLDNHIYEGPVD